ncbi:hypothetical protein FDH29_gp19 [Aquamicrobium phage P14]|uniref:Uncharacterized protein n=1 Tax=Aquamicrobium phage P14 TaxID=1927013 RepID=A0A1L5C067_9CAUD|nr:hypothetical protein FDH29_gp19 [Aquamicrobium phage P14]APL99477.1 hypothetical protein BB738_0190 [Aquamicrobium phage P14]
MTTFILKLIRILVRIHAKAAKANEVYRQERLTFQSKVVVKQAKRLQDESRSLEKLHVKYNEDTKAERDVAARLSQV